LKLLLVLIVVGAAGGAIYAFVGKGGGSENGLTLVDVGLGDITEKALAVGQIEPREKFQVKSKVSGIVKRCYVEVGDEVRAGDLLFEIAPDPTPQELLIVDHQLRSAQASFAKAEADYEMIKDLLESHLPEAPALFNEFHALFVELGKRYCKPRARCAGCPLEDMPHDEQE